MARSDTLISPDCTDWYQFREKVWPDTSHLEGADKASRYGCVGAGLLAFVFIIAALVFAEKGGLCFGALCCLTMAMVWVVIAQGIHRKSLLAAAAGLALWVVLAIWVWMYLEPIPMFDTAVFTWLFVNGFRGTIRWHEIGSRPGPTMS